MMQADMLLAMPCWLLQMAHHQELCEREEDLLAAIFSMPDAAAALQQDLLLPDAPAVSGRPGACRPAAVSPTNVQMSTERVPSTPIPSDASCGCMLCCNLLCDGIERQLHLEEVQLAR